MVILQTEALMAVNTALMECAPSLKAQLPQLRSKALFLLDAPDPKLRRVLSPYN